MSKYVLTQEWNPTKGWTVAERILIPKSFTISADFETVRAGFVEQLVGYKMIADHQKNASMETDGYSFAKLWRNNDVGEITVKMYPLND